MAYEFDPELVEAVALLPKQDITDVAAARRNIAEMVAALNGSVDTSGLEIEDRAVPGPGGAPDVPVRLYAPARRTGPGPALLYLHGGGFVMGSIDTEHASCTTLAREVGVVVASVGYRLAPEHPYPAPLEDCYAALRWLHGAAGGLGVDPARIGVCGQSGGGGLAAGLALLARDRGGPALCFQYLGIPELDDRLDTPSMRAFTDTPLWDRPSAVLSWRAYLGDLDGDVPPYAAPSRATDLAGLPPAYVSTMQYDPLRDEGILYALAMLQAGVPVELHQFAGTFHGSAVIAGAAISRRQNAERIEVLRRALGVAG